MARVLSSHERQRGLCQQKWPAQVDIDHLVPLLNGHLIDRERVIDRRAIDDDIQAAEMCIYRLDSFEDSLSIADIALERDTFSILVGQITPDPLRCFSIDVDTDNATARVSECSRCCFPKATSCPCYQGHFPL